MTTERPIREVEFAGTPFERGVQRGLMLRDTLLVPSLDGITPSFARACLEAAQAAYPPAVEEFEGILEGGGFDRAAMRAYYFARLESQVGCTMFAVSGPAGGAREPIVGRNYDWATADLKWCRLERYVTAPRRIGYSHHWAGCADLLSEAGLYVAIASLPPEPVRAPGVQWNIVTEMVSETCSTVAEAAEACARVRHLRPMSYLLADAHGDVGLVEATPREVRFREGAPLGGVCKVVIAANAPQGGDLVRAWDDGAAARSEELPPHYRGGAAERAEQRIARVQQCLEALPQQERPGADDIAAILKDHHAPICAGDHADPDGAPWSTIWSGLCEPSRGTFRIAPGLPCRHAYQEFRIA